MEGTESQTKTVDSYQRCKVCSQSFHCGVLYTAITVLDSEARMVKDQKCLAKIERFRAKVKGIGFGYPTSGQTCHVYNRRAMVTNLVDEARLIIDEIRASYRH